MTLLTDEYFEQFGFTTVRKGEVLDLTYGLIEELISPLELPRRSEVLFSIVQYADGTMKQTVTPAMLNMPSEPPFLITLNSGQEIMRLFDGHRRLADTNDFPHARVAQYLTLCHLGRAAGNAVDSEIIAFLTRSEMEWGRKLYTVLEPKQPGYTKRPKRVGFLRS